MGMLLFDDAGFTPRSLFASGEQGIWLDPSDFSTLYQDSAGTTPVTALGQPVGLALDKRLGLALGPELVTNPGPFTATTGWTASAAVLSTSSGSLIVTNSSAGIYAKAQTTITTIAGAWYKVNVTAQAGTLAPAVWVGTSVGGSQLLAFSGVIGQTKTAYFLAQGTTTHVQILGSNVLGETAAVSLVSSKLIAGNHAYQTTAASRPTLQQDSNGLYYLSFDGTDDSMATPSINFTGTDKMTVWAGVRKLSDAAAGTVVELSASATANLGGFFLRAPQAAASTYSFLSGGSAFSTAVSSSGYVAPISNILTGIGDISGDACSLRVNGTTVTSATDQGTGNYGNYPLYIGRRGGTTLPFNGRIYQLIIRGAESNAGQIAATEAWCNSKTRAY